MELCGWLEGSVFSGWKECGWVEWFDGRDGKIDERKVGMYVEGWSGAF